MGGGGGGRVSASEEVPPGNPAASLGAFLNSFLPSWHPGLPVNSRQGLLCCQGPGDHPPRLL